MSPSILASTFRNSEINPLDRGKILNKLLLCTTSSSLASSQPEPPSIDASGAVQAFDALEAVMSKLPRTKYRRRMEENNNLEGSLLTEEFGTVHLQGARAERANVCMTGATAERWNVVSLSTGATAEESSVASSSTRATAGQSVVASWSIGATEERTSRVALSTVERTMRKMPSTGVQNQLLCDCSTRDFNLSHP